MREEHDRDKPPYAVQERVITQGWYSLEGSLDRAEERLYVRLVLMQIERLARTADHFTGLDRDCGINCGEQLAHCQFVDFEVFQGWRPRIRQQQPHALAPVGRALPMISHLLPKVVGIKDQAVKQETGDDLFIARAALVPADANPRGAAAAQAPLECDRRIEHDVARAAAALTVAEHQDRAITVWATEARKHHVVTKRPRVLAQDGNGRGHLDRAGDQVPPGPVTR